MSFIRKHKYFFVSLVVTYAILIAAYYFTSVGIRPSTLLLQMRRYIPCAVVVALSLSLWKQAGLRLTSLLPHGIVAVFWNLVYPICYWYTFKDTLTFIDNHFDQAFGAYFFAFSVCLRIVLLRWNKWQDKKYMQYLFGFLHTIAVFIPLFQIGYFAN